MTFVIYVRCGKLIYQKRKQLRNATSVDSGMDLKEIPSVHYSKVTEVRVTSELASPCNAGTTGAPKRSSTYDPYSISIEANRPEASGPREVDTSMQPVIHRRANSHTHPRTTATDANTAAYAYTKYAMLYFIALLVTWVRPVALPQIPTHYHRSRRQSTEHTPWPSLPISTSPSTIHLVLSFLFKGSGTALYISPCHCLRSGRPLPISENGVSKLQVQNSLYTAMKEALDRDRICHSERIRRT